MLLFLLCSMAVHMDCLHWVNRDSYLPQGSRGLKVGLSLLACQLLCSLDLQRGQELQGIPNASTLAFEIPVPLDPSSSAPQMVTKYKLGYDPVEVDPEDMVGAAADCRSTFGMRPEHACLPLYPCRGL